MLRPAGLTTTDHRLVVRRCFRRETEAFSIQGGKVSEAPIMADEWAEVGIVLNTFFLRLTWTQTLEPSFCTHVCMSPNFLVFFCWRVRRDGPPPTRPQEPRRPARVRSPPGVGAGASEKRNAAGSTVITEAPSTIQYLHIVIYLYIHRGRESVQNIRQESSVMCT